MKERSVGRDLQYLWLEPDDLSESTTGEVFHERKTFGLIIVVVVGTLLLGLCSFLAFSGRLENTAPQAQTEQTASEDNFATPGSVATQDESASESPRWAWEPRYPRASFECMGYWCYIVQAFYAGPGS